MSSTVNYRRSQFLHPPPVAGDYLKSKSGKSLLKVLKVAVFRRAGEPAGRDLLRMELERGTPPPGIRAKPWPIEYKPPPLPVAEGPPPAAKAFKAVVAKATAASSPASRSRKQRQRDARRQSRVALEDASDLIPKAQREPVMTEDGQVFYHQKVTSSSWVDPEDANVKSRAPKMVGGYRRYDPIIILYRNGTIKVDHAVAAGLYRACWEASEGGAIPSGRDLTFSDPQYAPSMGIAEHRCANMAKWLDVQSKFDAPAKAYLRAIVLEGMPPTAWADKIHTPRAKVAGYLTAVLDHLLFVYADEVRMQMRQERSALD